jgi:NADH-quinone oxidoreductase subunit M
VGLWGVVISAVYMLRAYRSVFWGEPNRTVANWSDISPNLRAPVILLIAVLLIAGFFPATFLELITPSIKALLK